MQFSHMHYLHIEDTIKGRQVAVGSKKANPNVLPDAGAKYRTSSCFALALFMLVTGHGLAQAQPLSLALGSSSSSITGRREEARRHLVLGNERAIQSIDYEVPAYCSVRIKARELINEPCDVTINALEGEYRTVTFAGDGGAVMLIGHESGYTGFYLEGEMTHFHNEMGDLKFERGCYSNQVANVCIYVGDRPTVTNRSLQVAATTAQTDAPAQSPWDPAVIAGMYRWGGGMNQGVIWDSVRNKRGEHFLVDVVVGSKDESENGVRSAHLDVEPQPTGEQSVYFVVGKESFHLTAESDGEGDLTVAIEQPGGGSYVFDELLRKLRHERAVLLC